MNLALDYDNTYTRDKFLWNGFIKLAKNFKHNVYCVTMRSPAEGDEVRNDLGAMVDQIIFTSRKAKKEACYKLGIHIDVWIDDMPLFIIKDAPPDANYDATIGE